MNEIQFHAEGAKDENAENRRVFISVWLMGADKAGAPQYEGAWRAKL